jgi:hypothetical protein
MDFEAGILMGFYLQSSRKWYPVFATDQEKQL